jgi:RNA polymerase sigma factor (sigma-70 family)
MISYCAFQKMIVKLATRYSHSFPDLEAEDLIQDGFVTLFQSIQSKQYSNKNIHVKLKKEISATLSSSRYQHGKQKRVAEKLFAAGLDEPINLVEKYAVMLEQRTVLENALNHLPQSQKEAIKLCFGLADEHMQDLRYLRDDFPSAEALRNRARRGLKSLKKVPEVRQIYSEISA